MRDVYKDLTFSDKIFAKFSIKVADHFIVTNLHIKDKLAEWGTDENKITVIAPFLPPDEKESDFEEIPEFVWNFINNHSPVISANAFQLKFYKDQDLYGLDMCVELCDKLKSEYKNIGLVFSLPEIGDVNYFTKMKSIIIQKGIEKNFLFITTPLMLYPILRSSDLFLRPTNTDGDALSIREALSFSVPVIASDVVHRPSGTILFKNRDIDDLLLKTITVLEKLEYYKKELKTIPQEDNYLKTKNLIKRL
jgi:glycosyltransferase involved in cell wall biosynthesis